MGMYLIVYPFELGKMVGWDMVWVMLQEMDFELLSIPMEPCFFDMDNGLVRFLGHPSTIGSSEIW